MGYAVDGFLLVVNGFELSDDSSELSVRSSAFVVASSELSVERFVLVHSGFDCVFDFTTLGT